MKIMLATDVCRLVILDQPPELLSHLQQRSAAGDEILISAITYAELMAGVLLTNDSNRHLQLVQEFCERLDDVIPWDRDAIDAYTELQTRAVGSKNSLGLNDAMLVAHCISLQAGLLTSQPSHFGDIKALELMPWPADS